MLLIRFNNYLLKCTRYFRIFNNLSEFIFYLLLSLKLYMIRHCCKIIIDYSYCIPIPNTKKNILKCCYDNYQ